MKVNFPKSLAKNWLNLLLWLFIAANAFFVTSWVRGNLISDQTTTNIEAADSYPELDQLRGNTMSFQELSDYFTSLATAKGARYAYAVLKQADIPPNTDLHLLGHAVGNILYKQEGLEGITDCDQDFRNACSHSIVVGLFADKGEAAFPQIAEACKRAKGGAGAYTMCFHGLGHGIVSALAYDLPATVALCEKTGTPEHGYRESGECISGAIMELVGGGDHDKLVWSKKRPLYLSPTKPLSPCYESYMPQDGRIRCLDYLTPYFFELVGADLGHPIAKDFEKAFPYCAKVPKGDVAERDACYGGFGKEFIALVKDRDIRQDNLSSYTDDQLLTIYNWCKLAHNAEGTRSCSNAALNSLYWGGENDRHVSLAYCHIIPDSNDLAACYKNLISNVSFYINDSSYRQSFCQEVPGEYRDECKNRLGVNQ